MPIVRIDDRIIGCFVEARRSSQLQEILLKNIANVQYLNL
jgi:hypothetical protein